MNGGHLDVDSLRPYDGRDCCCRYTLAVLHLLRMNHVNEYRSIYKREFTNTTITIIIAVRGPIVRTIEKAVFVMVMVTIDVMVSRTGALKISVSVSVSVAAPAQPQVKERRLSAEGYINKGSGSHMTASHLFGLEILAFNVVSIVIPFSCVFVSQVFLVVPGPLGFVDSLLLLIVAAAGATIGLAPTCE